MRTLLLTLALALPLSAQVTNEVIIPRAAAARIYVPVAGSAAGANGTFFRTDMNLINLRTATQRVLIFWLPQGATGSATPAGTLEIPAQQGISSEDFVSEILGRSGIGAIEFVGVNADNSFDQNAALHVTSRIWTPRPDGSEGTMSQTFPAVVAGSQGTDLVKAVFGQRRGAQYRLNVGAMNPSSTTQRFRVTVAINGSGGTDTIALEFDVPARAIQQVLVPGTSSGNVQVLIEDLGGGAGDWQGWASSIDNQSGDAWSQIAVGGD
ncbi:MAG TPA: hypothetical protein VF883_20855 [Thermoanaerobaculia bacterium]|jgi:hypothetical protein